MPLHVPVLEGSLEVEHKTETLLDVGEGAPAGSWPTSKPANPQISFVSTALNEYSLSGMVLVRGWVSEWPAPITFYCELVLDGVSKGVKSRTNPGAADFRFYFGDYDPLITHNIQVYLWASDPGYTMPGPFPSSAAWFRTGTVSLTEKTVWKKREKKVSALLFSTDTTVDTSNLYLDATQISDLSLWWAGIDIILKGTDFDESDTELIYQLITVT